jgi:hypothetical protein
MLTAREASSGLFGAYRLALRDAGGLRFFDASLAGFWQSFYAAALVAPAYVLLLIVRYTTEMAPLNPIRYAAVNAISYVIAWVAFPLVMFYVSALFDRQQHYLRYIVAYNWAQVLQNALVLPIAIVERLGWVSPVFSLAAMILVLLYSGFIARVALDVPWLTVVGIVLLDWLLGVTLQVWTGALF